MHIDWNSFTPGAALAGGVLIGTAAVALALLAGRVAGISAIVGGLLRPQRGDAAWRLAFIAGLAAAPWAYAAFAGPPAVRVDASTALLVTGGVLVGWGSRLGSGCTSGHGICGLSRLSPRSLAATLAFMGAGFATVFVARHVLA
ncbi:MAG TPA: YeeE/YedE thiosulfate transporter family protein [Usitatibacter sp.]|nr:YeeE/YedE thiosulfate transporter family protein [Usitatibacter sp.]